MAVIAGIAVAAAAAVTTTLLLTTGGGGPTHRPPTAAQAARERAIAAGRALNVGRGGGQIVHRPQLRLGILAAPAAATGLAGIKLGYIAVQLTASGTDLTAQPYTSPAAEETALLSGRLDAAYLPPVQAIQAWQATNGKIRIIAGANSRGSTTVAVLAVTTTYLASHAGQVRELLKGHIQATTTLLTDPQAGHAAAAAELASLTAGKTTARHAASAVALIRGTCDPGAASLIAQAGTAASAGQLKPVTNLSAIFDLTPLNELLRAAGQAAVHA